jgi:TetR/AcrR family transcriptional repressor of nem operon
VARPRGFDEDAALDAATAFFWSHGYAATSIRDLGGAMGLGPASLYNAFGDKRALFRRCLDRYLDHGPRARIARLERDLPPRRAIETFLAEILSLSRRDRRGCLMVNTALDIGPHDRAIGALLRERLSEIEGFFARCLHAGQGDGSIQTDGTPADIARLLLAAVIGLRVLARTRASPDLLAGATRQALALLGPRGDPSNSPPAAHPIEDRACRRA